MTSALTSEEAVPTEVSSSRTVRTLRLTSAHANALALIVQPAAVLLRAMHGCCWHNTPALCSCTRPALCFVLPELQNEGHSLCDRRASIDSGLHSQVVRWSKARSRPMVLVIGGVLPSAEVYQARLPLAPTTLLARFHTRLIIPRT